MRSDYMLYTVAIIFFILTGVVAAYYLAQEQSQLWIVTTAVLGLVFIGLGYSQRPRPTTSVTTATPTTPTPTVSVPTTVPPPPEPVAQPATAEVVMEEKIESAVAALPLGPKLTEIKGIKEKRAAQLDTLGISTVEDLAKASAKDLATKLQISPKITGKWIESAKEIVEKS